MQRLLPIPLKTELSKRRVYITIAYLNLSGRLRNRPQDFLAKTQFEERIFRTGPAFLGRRESRQRGAMRCWLPLNNSSIRQNYGSSPRSLLLKSMVGDQLASASLILRRFYYARRKRGRTTWNAPSQLERNSFKLVLAELIVLLSSSVYVDSFFTWWHVELSALSDWKVGA